MSTIGQILIEASGSINIWRDAVIAALACIVIGALYLYATVLGVE